MVRIEERNSEMVVGPDCQRFESGSGTPAHQTGPLLALAQPLAPENSSVPFQRAAARQRGSRARSHVPLPCAPCNDVWNSSSSPGYVHYPVAPIYRWLSYLLLCALHARGVIHARWTGLTLSNMDLGAQAHLLLSTARCRNSFVPGCSRLSLSVRFLY